MGATVAIHHRGRKAMRAAGCTYRITRRKAVSRYVRAVAATMHRSAWTIRRELTDPARSPVAKVAAEVRALAGAGAGTVTLDDFLAEVTDAYRTATVNDARTFEELVRAETLTQADEDILEAECLMHPGDRHCRAAWLERLARHIAVEQTLVARFGEDA